jgi:hypothetical protein
MDQLDQLDKGLAELPTNPDLSPAIEPEGEVLDHPGTWLLGRLTSAPYLYRYILLILLMALTSLALLTTSLRPTHVTIQGMGNRIQNITLPLMEHSNRENQTYVLTGNFSYGLFSQHIVHIVPDNCIKSFQINGRRVDLHAIITGNICNFTNGFDIDLKSYLQDGTNHFQIRLINHGRDDWLRLILAHSTYDSQYLFLLYILLLEVGALLYFFLKNQLQLPRGCVIVILLGLMLHILYLSYTPFNVRMHDVMPYGGHLDYIKYMATHWQLPVPTSGWEYFQPPLYYISAAIIYKIATNLSINSLFALQALSLAYFTVFLIFGVLILRMLCQKKWMLFTGTALLAFWPSGIIHAVRIGNDVPYYTLSVIGVYFLLRWLVDKESKHFYLGTLFMELMIITKSNGLILVVIFVCICLLLLFRKVIKAISSGQMNNGTDRPLKCILKHIRFPSPEQAVREPNAFFSSPRWLYENRMHFPITQLFHFCLKQPQVSEYTKKAMFFIIIIILALYISLFRSINIALYNHQYNILDSNSSSDARALAVNNSLCNLFCFDLNTYISQPFTDPWHDEGGRQYLWNYFLKSMLFGEFSFSFTYAPFLAIVLSTLLLQIVAFVFIGIVRSIYKLNVPHLFMLLWVFLSLLSLLYFRYTNPFAPNQDFRYIFPMIIPLIYFYLTGIDFFTKRKFILISDLGYIIAFLFVIASFCFFIVPLGK